MGPQEPNDSQSFVQPTYPPMTVTSSEPSIQTVPQSSVPEPLFTPPVPLKRGMGRKGKVLTALAIFIMLLVVSSVGALYALAYHKIDLSSNPELQKKIEFFVMEFPMTPKSARYLVYKTATIERNYSSQSFDISAAVNTNSTQPDLLGLTNFDIAAKGDLDFKDKDNLLLNMNLSITKDFNVDLKAAKKMVYFKVNKVPTAILAVLGLNADVLSPLLNTWVSYDTTPLQTDARDLLKQSDTSTGSLDEDISKQLDEYLDQSILSQMVVTKGEDGEVPVYKLHLTMTSEMIDSLEAKINEKTNKTSDLYIMDETKPKKKLSDGVKDMAFDIWLDQKTYYTRRVSMSFKITPDTKLGETVKEDSKVLGISDSIVPSLDSTVSVAVVFKFSDFGKEVTVDAPADALTFEEFSKKASELLLQLYTTQPSVQH